jgi:hypothetical protein
MTFRIGDRVVKDPAGWRPAECDPPGAGDGVGTVAAVLTDSVSGSPAAIVVSWPRSAGRCCHWSDELLPAPGQSAD